MSNMENHYWTRNEEHHDSASEHLLLTQQRSSISCDNPAA